MTDEESEVVDSNCQFLILNDQTAHLSSDLYRLND